MMSITRGDWSLRRSGTNRPDSAKQYMGEPYVEWGTLEAVRHRSEVGVEVKNVALVFQGDGPIGSPEALKEQKANALLLRAAPTLFNACMASIQAIEDGEENIALIYLETATREAMGIGVDLDETPATDQEANGADWEEII